MKFLPIVYNTELFVNNIRREFVVSPRAEPQNPTFLNFMAVCFLYNIPTALRNKYALYNGNTGWATDHNIKKIYYINESVEDGNHLAQQEVDRLTALGYTRRSIPNY